MDDMDLHTMMMGGMVLNMIGTKGVEALEEGSEEVKSGTNTTMNDGEDDNIADRFHMKGGAEVKTEVGDVRGGVIPGLPAVIVEVDQEGIIVDVAVVTQDGGGLGRELVHGVVQGVEEGVIIRMAEIENVAVRLHHGPEIEAQRPRTGAVHMAVIIIVINQRMKPMKPVRNK